MKLIILAMLFSLSTLAHEEHDWRYDYEAYLSINYEAPLIFRHKSKRLSLKLSHHEIDMEFFKEKLAILTGDGPYIKDGKELFIKERRSQKSLDIARSFLDEEYQKLGFSTELHTFGGGVNFIAEKKGSRDPQKILILSSHIDSVGNKGANDNGTGTIGLLAVSKVLASLDLGLTIRILGFDREEVGLRGSDAYVASIAGKEEIIGNINFEMMGVNARNDGAFHVIDCRRSESLFLSEAIKSSILERNLPLSIVTACTNRSDHASFWRRNIPAVVISENFFGGDADPCYHSRCDVMDERLNYPYMKNILLSVLEAVKKLGQ